MHEMSCKEHSNDYGSYIQKAITGNYMNLIEEGVVTEELSKSSCPFSSATAFNRLLRTLIPEGRCTISSLVDIDSDEELSVDCDEATFLFVDGMVVFGLICAKSKTFYRSFFVWLMTRLIMILSA